MKDAAAAVKAFHAKHGFPAEAAPTRPAAAVALMRVRLMMEEFEELVRALNEGDLAGIADGAADLIYTVIGTCVACGLPIPELLADVCASNATKTVLDAGGKGGKGAGYRPPRTWAILAAAEHGELGEEG